MAKRGVRDPKRSGGVKKCQKRPKIDPKSAILDPPGVGGSGPPLPGPILDPPGGYPPRGGPMTISGATIIDPPGGWGGTLLFWKKPKIDFLTWISRAKIRLIGKMAQNRDFWTPKWHFWTPPGGSRDPKKGSFWVDF